MNDTLNIFGMNVILASNGQEALNSYSKNSSIIDLIVTDIMMPELNGISLIAEIRKTNKNVPIIIISAFQNLEYFIDAFKYDVRAYLLKPLDITALRKTIINVCESDVLRRILSEQNEKLNNEIQARKIHEKTLISQSKFIAMGEMIQMIAHQWRQPLSAINTSIFSLRFDLEYHHKKKYIPKKYVIEQLNQTQTYIKNMSTTIDDFMNFYKTDKEKHKININDIINLSLKIIEPLLSYSEVIVKKHFKSIKKLEVYKNELSHVFLNLYKNVLDKFEESEDKQGIISISTTDTKTGVKITVHDNGKKNK